MTRTVADERWCDEHRPWWVLGGSWPPSLANPMTQCLVINGFFATGILMYLPHSLPSYVCIVFFCFLVNAPLFSCLLRGIHLVCWRWHLYLWVLVEISLEHLWHLKQEEGGHEAGID